MTLSTDRLARGAASRIVAAGCQSDADTRAAWENAKHASGGRVPDPWDDRTSDLDHRLARTEPFAAWDMVVSTPHPGAAVQVTSVTSLVAPGRCGPARSCEGPRPHGSIEAEKDEGHAGAHRDLRQRANVRTMSPSVTITRAAARWTAPHETWAIRSSRPGADHKPARRMGDGRVRTAKRSNGNGIGRKSAASTMLRACHILP